MARSTIYTLEHHGEKFRMHGITSVVVNSTLSCNLCKRGFALEAIPTLLDFYIDRNCPCRDVTCCQAVGHTDTGIIHLPLSMVKQPKPEHLPGEPGFEHEVECEPAVCRWCKGAGEITINFKTKPCDCVKQENIGCVGQDDIGRGWHVKKKFTMRA